MGFTNTTDTYLTKTYCHLKNKVLVDNQNNWNEFPMIENWGRIEKEILDAMKAIENELKSRGLPLPSC